MSQPNIYTCTARNLRQILTTLLDAGLVPFITSSPGMGKSSIIRALARDFSLKLIDHRVSTSEPTDFSGLPNIQADHAKMVPFTDIFPLSTMEIPQGYNGWLLFLDEFNSGTKQVQAASYRPVLDHQVGQFDLHPDCRIVLAGNKATDRAIVNSLSTAMQSRVIHLELELNFDIWFEDVAVPENYHPTIKAFLLNNKTRLMDFDPDHQNKTFCCPRTWEFMNDQVTVTDGPVEYMYPAYVGTITPGVATEFIQFCRVFDNLIKKEDVLANPSGVPVPTDNATRWALLCSMMSWVDTTNFSTLATYANRFAMDMRVFFYRAVMGRFPDLRRNPEFISACSQVSHLLT